MRKLHLNLPGRLLILAFLLSTLPAYGVSKYQGYAERGGTNVLSNLTGATVKAQRSYPGAIVTVYNAGTATLATIGSNASMTAKANPFTADTDGYWFFFAASEIYDIQFTAAGTSWTRTGVSGGTIVASTSIVDVRGAGCAGDGVTDDTACIQALLTAYGNAGRTLDFGNGTYKITSTLTCSTCRDITFRGDFHTENQSNDCVNACPDTRLFWAGASTTTPMFYFDGGHTVRFEFMYLDGQATSASATHGMIGILVDGNHTNFTYNELMVRRFDYGVRICSAWRRTDDSWHPGSKLMEEQSVTSITSVGTTATATTAAAHGYATGQLVEITGATGGTTGYNGMWVTNGGYTITVTSATTFTYTLAGAIGSAATGTLKVNKINSTQAGVGGFMSDTHYLFKPRFDNYVAGITFESAMSLLNVIESGTWVYANQGPYGIVITGCQGLEIRNPDFLGAVSGAEIYVHGKTSVKFTLIGGHKEGILGTQQQTILADVPNIDLSHVKIENFGGGNFDLQGVGTVTIKNSLLSTVALQSTALGIVIEDCTLAIFSKVGPTAGTRLDIIRSAITLAVNDWRLFTQTKISDSSVNGVTYLRNGFVSLYLNAVQSIPDATNTDVVWDAETADVEGYHTNPAAAITIPVGGDGTYAIQTQLRFASNGTGRRDALILVDATVKGLVRTNAITGTTANVQAVRTMQLVAAQVVKVQGFQDSGGALNLEGTGADGTGSWVTLTRID